MKDEQISLFREKDSLKNDKITNLETIITMKESQLGLEKEKSNSLLKELKKERRKSFFYRVGSFVGIVSLSLLLLQ